MDNIKEPKKLASGRPERYEMDDSVSLGSPPKYTMLKAFDAKHIFSRNPHKYDSLIAQEDAYSKDDSSISGKFKSGSDFAPRPRLRSNSFSSLDEIAAQTSMEKTELLTTDAENSRSTTGALNRADDMYRRCSLDHMTDYYSRRSSDVAISAIWEAPGYTRWRSRDKVTVESAVASYKQDKKKMEAFGERHLTEIMMKAAFKEPWSSPKREGLDVPSVDRRGSSSAQEESSQSTRPGKELHISDVRQMSLPETAKGVQRGPLSEEVSAKLKVVQPVPRRLFGIGPLYHPLPETVVERPLASDDKSLVDTVKKEGILPVAANDEPVKEPFRRKKAPTKAEMNTWAPFSM